MAEQTEQRSLGRPAVRAHPQRLAVHRRPVQCFRCATSVRQGSTDLRHPVCQPRLQRRDGNPGEDALHSRRTGPLCVGETETGAPRLTIVLRPIGDARLPARPGEHRHAGKQEQCGERMAFPPRLTEIRNRREDLDKGWYDLWHGFLLRIVTSTSLSYRMNPLPLSTMHKP
jgi:hypothetical protein